MKSTFSRRRFLSAVAALPVGAILLNPGRSKSEPPSQTGRRARDRGPRLDMAQVEEFVGAAHGDLDKVKTMLEERPALVNATWDWGGGDWETGLGGASHMGRRDIALFLLDHNARMDVFAAAMLGQVEIVKAAVAAFPGIHKVPGPHGIPLIVHARKGGEHATEVLKYLESLEPA